MKVERPRCRCLFATHYHELTRLAERCEALSLHHVRAREWKGELVLLHHRRRRHPGEARHRQAIGAIRRTLADLVQQHQFALPLWRRGWTTCRSLPPRRRSRKNSAMRFGRRSRSSTSARGRQAVRRLRSFTETGPRPPPGYGEGLSPPALPLFAAAAQIEEEQCDAIRAEVEKLDVDALSPREAKAGAQAPPS
jgi:DNA mismatch repair protein MutS